MDIDIDIDIYWIKYILNKIPEITSKIKTKQRFTTNLK